MLTVSELIVTALTCISLLPVLRSASLAAYGIALRCAAFGVIVPATMGFGSRFFECYVKKETNDKLLRGVGATSLAVLTWALLRGSSMEARVGFSLISLYAYNSGRRYFPQPETAVQKEEKMTRFAQNQSMRDLMRFSMLKDIEIEEE